MWDLDPFKEIERMRRQMDELFSRLPFYERTSYQFPLVNLYDDKDDLLLTAEIPGLLKEDVNIQYNDGALTISGKRKAGAYGTSELLRQEQPEGNFEKRVRIPVKIRDNEIRAKFEDGILKVTLPKAEEAKPRQITIES